jgi:UDP-GlcNAc:undecaprenyl-phosphate/decaprenyl-phosphate GlcNAc-1-phosphate transferase
VSYLLIGLVSAFTTLTLLCAILLARGSRRGVAGGPTRTGGLAMAAALGAVALFATTRPIGTEQLPAAGMAPALAGGLLVFFLGWVDDLRPLPPIVKLLGQIVAASVAYALGLRAGFIADGGLDWAFTVFCLVGGSNALNLIDGMDGLAGSVAAVASTIFFFMARDLGNVDAAALAVALAGCSAAG